MKGLLLKDFYNLKKSMKTTLAILVMYGIFGIVTDQASFLSSLVAILCAIVPISTFSYDDFSKWDSYALSMPISRKTIVLGKYLMALLSIAAGLLFALAAGLLTLAVNGREGPEISELLVSTGAIAGLCIFILALTIPVVIRFGVEKGRIVMIAMFLIPTMSILLFMRTAQPTWIPSEQELERLLFLTAVSAPIAALLSLAVSVAVSFRLYNNKEF